MKKGTDWNKYTLWDWDLDTLDISFVICNVELLDITYQKMDGILHLAILGFWIELRIHK